MANQINVKNKIENFNKRITVSGDKSLSIRWVLFSSIAIGKSKAYNLLLSEDVLAAINAVKKLGAQVKLNKNNCTVIGNGPSAIGFIPKIAEKVGKLTIFQRSNNWIVPKPDRPYGVFEKFCLRNIPFLARLYRFYFYLMQERNYLAFYYKHNKAVKFFEKAPDAITDFSNLYSLDSDFIIVSSLLICFKLLIFS